MLLLLETACQNGQDVVWMQYTTTGLYQCTFAKLPTDHTLVATKSFPVDLHMTAEACQALQIPHTMHLGISVTQSLNDLTLTDGGVLRTALKSLPDVIVDQHLLATQMMELGMEADYSDPDRCQDMTKEQLLSLYATGDVSSDDLRVLEWAKTYRDDADVAYFRFTHGTDGISVSTSANSTEFATHSFAREPPASICRPVLDVLSVMKTQQHIDDKTHTSMMRVLYTALIRDHSRVWMQYRGQGHYHCRFGPVPESVCMKPFKTIREPSDLDVRSERPPLTLSVAECDVLGIPHALPWSPATMGTKLEALQLRMMFLRLFYTGRLSTGKSFQLELWTLASVKTTESILPVEYALIAWAKHQQTQLVGKNVVGMLRITVRDSNLYDVEVIYETMQKESWEDSDYHNFDTYIKRAIVCRRIATLLNTVRYRGHQDHTVHTLMTKHAEGYDHVWLTLDTTNGVYFTTFTKPRDIETHRPWAQDEPKYDYTDAEWCEDDYDYYKQGSLADRPRPWQDLFLLRLTKDALRDLGIYVKCSKILPLSKYDSRLADLRIESVALTALFVGHEPDTLFQIPISTLSTMVADNSVTTDEYNLLCWAREMHTKPELEAHLEVRFTREGLYTFSTVEKNPPMESVLPSTSNPVTPIKQIDTVSKTSPPSIKRRRCQPDTPKHPVYVIRRDVYRLRRAMEEHCDPKHNAKIIPTLAYHMQHPAIPSPIYRYAWLYPVAGGWVGVLQSYRNRKRLGFPDAEASPVSSDEADEADAPRATATYDDITDPGTSPSPDGSPRTSPVYWSPLASPDVEVPSVSLDEDDEAAAQRAMSMQPDTPPSPDVSPKTSPMNWSPPSSPAQPSPPPRSPLPSPSPERRRASVSRTQSPEF